MLNAARELFIAKGYGATTIEQIAQRAGVSKPTVFNVVGNKQTLLRTVRDVAIAGDDAPVPVAKRPAAANIANAPDQRSAVELIAHHLTNVATRYAEVQEVVHAAAASGDDQLRQLWEAEEQQRLAGARHWVGVLTDKGPLRDGLDTDTAVDILWLLMAPDNYYRLVNRGRWTSDKYQRWLNDSITRMLLPEQP
ncbi:MAG: TetR/AcrR family transcriptional regulator [Actinomycetota bacterium]|nr:TetR/AcrR family transcriptional regulator [Actinomycetota bacterium]